MTVENSAEQAIEFLTNPARPALASLILAHGAGAPMDTPFMNTIAEGLAATGVQVYRFEFPYMVQRRQQGSKRPPNRQTELLECWQRAIDQVPIKSPLFIGGKSMGGRMASLIVEQHSIAGLICLGYPFHPTGKPEKLRTEHLQALQTPTLILQGERDTLGNTEEVPLYPLSGSIEVHWLPDGDHSFKPRKKSGYTLEGNMQLATARIAEFIKSKLD